MTPRMSPALPGYVPDACDDDIIAARRMCADRLRQQGHESEAQAYEAGERDASWGLLHEIRRPKG